MPIIFAATDGSASSLNFKFYNAIYYNTTLKYETLMKMFWKKQILEYIRILKNEILILEKINLITLNSP